VPFASASAFFGLSKLSVWWLRLGINLSQVFAGQNVGIKEVAEKIWLGRFMHYDLGFFDEEADRVECAENPFDAKVLPMCPV
jgi:putative transposase